LPSRHGLPNVFEFGGKVAKLEGFSSVRAMLALHCADRGGSSFVPGNEENGILTAILRFPEYLNRALKDNLAHL